MENFEDLRLNVSLLRRRVPNLTTAAKSVGLRPATVSNLCNGKISVGKAEVRTLVALATLAECSMEELIIRGEKVNMIETKIKMLDLFAPLVKGGTVGLVARPGMGQLVVLSELLYRLRKSGAFTHLLLPEMEQSKVHDILPFCDSVSKSTEEAYQFFAASDDSNEIIFAADRAHVISGQLYKLQERLQLAGIDHVTTLLVDLKGEVVDEDLPFGPLDTLWQFDIDLAIRNYFPAINPIYSTSSVLEGSHVDQLHFNTQQRAKKVLRRYRELRTIVMERGMNGIPTSETQTYKRGELLESYLTQPFYVAEDYTGKSGVEVSLHQTIHDVQKILDGSMDTAHREDVSYIGTLQNS